MKKILTGIAAISCAAIVLCGCGGANNETKTGGGTAASAPTPTPAPMTVEDFQEFIADYVSLDDYKEPEYSMGDTEVKYLAKEPKHNDVVSGEVIINDNTITLPCTVQELIDAGWEAEENTYGSAYFRDQDGYTLDADTDFTYNDQFEDRTVTRINTSGYMNSDDPNAWIIHTPKSFEFDGINQNSDINDLIALYGEPHLISFDSKVDWIQLHFSPGYEDGVIAVLTNRGQTIASFSYMKSE